MSDSPVKIPPCCFCGKSNFDYPDPTMLTVSTSGEITRIWNCHVGCFNERASGIAEPWDVHDAGWPQE